MTAVAVVVLGGYELVIDDRHVPEPSRRDAARLAKLLALTPGRRMHREVLVDALWPDADPATTANRLHKAAHFVRRASGRADSVVLDGTTVAMFPGADVTVDADDFERMATRALVSGDREELRRAADAYTGDLLPHDPYEDWVFHHRQRLQLRHREVLRALGDHARLVELEPTDEAAHVGVMRDLIAHGDRAGVVRQFAVLRRVLADELGVGPSAEAVALRDLAGGRPIDGEEVARPRAATLATQRVGFCTTQDGVRLAHAVSGSGPPLVKASTWLTHLDHDWASPVWRHWWEALSSRHTLVRYDERGCGLSDWDIDADSFSLDAWVRDLETVVDALGLDRFPLLGISQGGPIAITYAHRHPERVSHVIVVGTCARAVWARADEDRRRELAALGQLIRASWGSDQPGFRQVYGARFLPDGPLELWRAFDELQRRSTSARNARRLWNAFGSLDCAEAARELAVPTLILHADEDRVWDFAEAEELHQMVRDSRLVRLQSRNHILQPDEPAFGHLLDEVERFLAT
jgi:DNA-binding SARP family transcriptional activator/pimeloyl-ACP methyl ester carboxylesterase